MGILNSRVIKRRMKVTNGARNPLHGTAWPAGIKRAPWAWEAGAWGEAKAIPRSHDRIEWTRRQSALRNSRGRKGTCGTQHAVFVNTRGGLLGQPLPPPIFGQSSPLDHVIVTCSGPTAIADVGVMNAVTIQITHLVRDPLLRRLRIWR